VPPARQLRHLHTHDLEAGETMRALMPAMRPLCWSSTFRVSSRLMLRSAMMSGMVARPVWQMCRKGMISVWQRGMT
jgi:hypothetical protein